MNEEGSQNRDDHKASELRAEGDVDADKKLKAGFSNDMGNIKVKVSNTLREYYNYTAENISAILDGRYFGTYPDFVIILGNEYKREKKSGKEGADANSNTNANVGEMEETVDGIERERAKGSKGAETPTKKMAKIIGLNSGLENYPEKLKTEIESFIWCTYRYNCESRRKEENGEGFFTTDAGWGCMLRAGQSLMAQALQHHHSGRDWHFSWENADKRYKYLQILERFIDDTNEKGIYSIYNMAQAGKSQGKHAGEWYGPFGTANVLKQLADSDPKFSPRTYVTSDGIIQVQDLVTLEEGVTMEELFKRQPEQKMKMEPTLILVATRLGIDRVNPIYFRFIKTCLSSKLCVGIAGGKPSSALYFIGFEGDDLVYLDPHFNKPKINRRNSYSEYNSADVASYRCSEMKKTHISRIDPCMFVGFYIDSVDSLLSLYLTLKPFESVVILSTEPPVCEVGAGTSVDDLGVLSGGDDDSF